MVKTARGINSPSGVLDNDYEAQRQANIRANIELMKTLGLYQTDVFDTRKAPPAKRPKRDVTPASSRASASPESTPSPKKYDQKRLDRPARVTRSLSRTLLDNGVGSSRDLAPRRSASLAQSRSPDEKKRYRFKKLSDFIASDYDDDYNDNNGSEYSRSPSPFKKRYGLYSARHYYPDESELQRHADRLGVRIHDPKTFGGIPGIEVGRLWEKRIGCSTDAVHAPTVAGISGNEDVGCWSICLSGGYEDDVDEGETFTYSGSGGRDLKGTLDNPKNLRTAPQSSDQKWEGKNAALLKSVQTGKPVRVVRGYKGCSIYSPPVGYVYSGLYKVTRAWMETGRAGFQMCRFEFRRLPRQPPLPTFPDDDEEEEEEEEEDDNNDDDDNDDGGNEDTSHLADSDDGPTGQTDMVRKVVSNTTLVLPLSSGERDANASDSRRRRSPSTSSAPRAKRAKRTRLLPAETIDLTADTDTDTDTDEDEKKGEKAAGLEETEASESEVLELLATASTTSALADTSVGSPPAPSDTFAGRCGRDCGYGCGCCCRSVHGCENGSETERRSMCSRVPGLSLSSPICSSARVPSLSRYRLAPPAHTQALRLRVQIQDSPGNTCIDSAWRRDQHEHEHVHEYATLADAQFDRVAYCLSDNFDGCCDAVCDDRHGVALARRDRNRGGDKVLVLEVSTSRANLVDHIVDQSA
ncbi:hypothetical protein BCV70DRAFT_197809 [Testicularia cyperi]|uniref:YDG domain-containing protein n=1 Tax=Testicularia cyperi TaxID=1882483 RepID=A0A317XZ91_9BASI|nr:hypothetical protein BCV70DRAFT_197809 [Testicularia cyperi]